MLKIKENERLALLNHSCAHLLAQAVSHLYPGAKFWVGPVIDEGFYYDMDLGERVIKEEDLSAIEKEMKKIAKDGKRIIRHEISKDEALNMFKDDPYKLDLINQMGDDANISCYTQGDFTDLCRGPHVESVKELKYFKLLKVSGAYWKNDAHNKMLQRVYGICFDTKEELDEHLYKLEEAKKSDHRKLGKELGIFTLSEYAPGCPIFLPNGMILRNILENFWYEEHTNEGYQFVKTPIMMSRELWETSGHWDHYQNNMYTTLVDDHEYAIKPMNCPGSLVVYKSSLHSYRDLPLRMGELGLVHRNEASGALSGLFRVRSFTQDDAHIFLREDQTEEEVIRLINFIDRFYKIFHLDYTIELSTRPEKDYIGSLETWDRAEKALADACHHAGKELKINPGDGAIYGPKLDFHIFDNLGREWQCATIQLDMNLPERFDINYIDENGEKKRPLMLHRVIFGSIERFMGILIERYKGVFPLWLAPEQVVIIPVHHENHRAYANEVLARLKEVGLRASVDARNEKLGYRMREAQTKKVPYVLVLGDSEMQNKSVNIRRHGKKDTEILSLEECVKKLHLEDTNKDYVED